MADLGGSQRTHARRLRCLAYAQCVLTKPVIHSLRAITRRKPVLCSDWFRRAVAAGPRQHACSPGHVTDERDNGHTKLGHSFDLSGI